MEKKCKFCPRVCHKQEHLDRHERTHTKARPYRCEECEKYFVRRFCHKVCMTYFSDTLKRHQKLHIAETQRGSKRMSKRAKRNRAGANSDTTPSDGSKESSVHQSPVQEVAEPQFSYYSLEEWEYPSLHSAAMDTAFSFARIDEVEIYFEDTFPAIDGRSSIGSIGSELTINPEFLLELV